MSWTCLSFLDCMPSDIGMDFEFPVVHTYPTDEPDHLLDSSCSCWCGPKIEPEEHGGVLVIHNRRV